MRLAYPLGDLAQLLFVVTVFGVLGWRPGRSWGLLGLGVAMFAVADSLYVFQDATGSYVGGSWIDAMWPAASLAMAAAAWQPQESRVRRDDGWAMMGGEQLDEVVRGAELHDVGKMAVPDAILHKPAGLDPDGWAFMHQHTIIGERILAVAPALRPVGLLVRSGHERWDGRGYPDGLAGDAIPLGSRITAVCDANDAMRSNRRYRTACTEAEALAELRRCAGRQFDPAVVEAFCSEISAPALEAVAQPV